MAAEAEQQAGGALGDEVERIAQVQAGNRAAGALDDAAFAGGKGEHRAVQLVLDARGEDADDAFVPACVEQGDAGRRVVGVERFEQDQRLFLHAGFDLAALAVERVELLGDLQGAAGVFGEQAFDAEAHVGEAAGGIQARAEDEAEVHRRRLFRVAAGGLEQRGEAGLQLAGAHALQALADQDAVVAVELDDVGDGAERDEVEQAGEVGFGLVGEEAALAQFGAQGEHDVEHDADAGDALGREVAARLVRVHDAVGLRQAFPPAGGGR